MIEWIFFDVGSTLVDESKAWEKRVSDTVKGSNISVSEFYKLMDDCALKNLIPYDDAVIISGLNRAEWHSEDVYKRQCLCTQYENRVKFTQIP